MANATFNTLADIQQRDQPYPTVRTRLIQDESGEVIEKQYMIIDILRMAVVPLSPGHTPEWWRSNEFFTNATI